MNVLRTTCAIVFAATLIVPWAPAGQPTPLQAPAYVDPDEPFEAVWRGEDEIIVTYTTDGDTKEASLTDTGDGHRMRIPALGETDAKTMTLQILDPGTGDVKLERALPIPEVAYHDITGDAAVVLTYPLEGVEGHAQFIPCCTIYNGLLRTMSLETNPFNSEEGLPEQLVKPFVILKPDHLAATTSGLGLVLKFGKAPAEGLEPAIFSYNSNTERWERVGEVDVDAVDRTLTTPCPNGGAFILGWAPR